MGFDICKFCKIDITIERGYSVAKALVEIHTCKLKRTALNRGDSSKLYYNFAASPQTVVSIAGNVVAPR